jgi:uncharacterized protein YycO
MIGVLIFCVLAGCVTNPSAQPQSDKATYVEWPAGTVLVSRNKDEDQNTSPGFENHLALYIGNGIIVESQADVGVIQTPFEVYKARAYDWFPMFPVDLNVGQRAADRAKTLVGIPYRRLSSLMPEERIEERGLNCVSVIRVSYVYAIGHSLPKLKIPDDILKMTEVFTRNWVYRPQTIPAVKKAA